MALLNREDWHALARTNEWAAVAAQPDKVIRVRKHRTPDPFPHDLKVGDLGLCPTETVAVIFADH